MKKTLIALTILSFFACNKAKESMQDAVTGTMEKVIENKTGTQVDLPDADDIANNGGYINYKSETKTYLTDDKKMQATMIIQKENEDLTIALQLVGEAGESFVVTISHIPNDFSLPLKGKFAVNNQYDGINPSATVLFMNVTENGMMASELPYEGEITLTKLTKDEVKFELAGKGGNASDAESPSNWKAISGSGKLVNPIIMSYGIDKNKVLK